MSAQARTLAPQQAAAITNIASGLLQRKCACGTHTIAGGECTSCQKEKPSANLQRSATSSEPVNAVPPIVHEVLRSPGRPLDSDARAFFEPRFDYDFSRVRVHTDVQAAESARAVNALAYTVGPNVVFGAGQYAPGTIAGRELIGHELTHILQQQQDVRNENLTVSEATDAGEQEADHWAHHVLGEAGGQPGVALARIAQRGRSRLQRQAVRTASGRFVGNVSGPTNNLREEVLQVLDRLHLLWSISDADYAIEQPAVSALAPGSLVAKASIPKTIGALTRNQKADMSAAVATNILGQTFSASVGQAQTNNKADILTLQDALHSDWFLSNSDFNAEHAAVNASPDPTIKDSLIPKTLVGLSLMKLAIAGGTFRRDLFAGTHTVTKAEHTAVEKILRPGSTVSSGGTVTSPKMTGAGAGGPFEKAMLKSLKENIGEWATNFKALKAQAGQPAFPITKANPIAGMAQQETERYFGPFIRAASRNPADVYRPGGSYSLVAKLGDQSTRALDDAYSPSGRRGWTEGYWMTLSSCPKPLCPQAVLNNFNVATSRSPDIAEYTRVGILFATNPANRPDIDDAIHSWPAEAGTGTVFIQPFVQKSTTADPLNLQERRTRWDIFTTLIHEMLHVLAHPNFAKTSEVIKGTAQKYLTEGFADVMRHELWDGPGALKSRLAGPEMATLRQLVEGKAYPYNPAVVVYHNDYPEHADALKIDNAVGHANAKAAYFLGHTELLGLGEGTSSATPLTGIAQYKSTDPKLAEEIVAAAGDTYATIQDRTNAPAGGIKTAAGVSLAVGASIAASTKLRVPGIKWVYAIQGDTLGSIGQQHNVPLAALAKANKLPPGTPAAHAMPLGTRVLVPIHVPLP